MTFVSSWILLISMIWAGLPYTWSNNRWPPHRILERLDRSLCTEAWSHVYGEYTLHHLPCIGSDHYPLLLIDVCGCNHQSQIFLFKNLWLIHPRYHDVVEQAWRQTASRNNSFSDKFTTVQRELLLWKKETFGSFTFTLRRL